MKKAKEQKPEVSTTDLYYSAYLQTSGLTMIRTDRDGSRIYFVFEDNEKLEKLAQNWTNYAGKVSAQLYANAIKNLKTLCHQSNR
jgi:hypothetical protein